MFKATILLLTACVVCPAQDQSTKDATQQMQELLELRKEMKEMKASKAPQKFYKLDLVLREVDGERVLNSRTYSISASTDSTPASIRAMARKEGQEAGVRIDIRNLREQQQNQLSLSLTADVTGFVEAADAASHTMLREFQWSSDVLVPIRKTTLVYSSESTTSKTQMQIEVTATPLL